MAAETELKKINEFVQECTAITSVTGAYVYGIDSNGDSIKIAVETLASAGTDYSEEIAALNTKCNNNATLITALQLAVNGKANAVHTHQISDVAGLQTALNGKADAVHTHQISDVAGLQTALNGKADAVHTHAIGDVLNLQPTLSNHEMRISDLEEQGGGTSGNALKQVDITTYDGGTDGEIVMHTGETTAAYINGYTYKCTLGEAEKTIPEGSQCIRLYQGGEEYISDGEADTSTTKMVMVLQPSSDGVTYNVFAAPEIATADIEQLVGCYVSDDRGVIHTITAITHDGTTLSSVTLDNGVTLEITSSTPVKSSLAWYEFYSRGGVAYYGGSGSTGYMIASKTLVSSPNGAQSYPIATEPIGTAFGGTIQNFTATADIVIRSVEWTQSPTQPETSVALGDAFLSKTDGSIGSTISIYYNSTNQHLELKGINGAVVAYVDMAVFIKDGMLENVEKYTTPEQEVTVAVPYLKFTFNTDSGKSVIRISFADLIDTFDGSNVDLTSAFVKAAQYSAPAIGDSMNVAIGKLLKGHEDNAAAIATKQDTLTFDDAPTTGSNNPVTSGGIKAAIDSAISTTAALKQKDLTLYEGTVGEIVQHAYNTEDNLINGYVYKCVESGAEYPEDVLAISLRNFTPSSQEDADLFATITDPNFFLTEDTITIYSDAFISAGLYLGDKVTVEVGDTLYIQPNMVSLVSTVNQASYPQDVFYSNNNAHLTVTKSFQAEVWRNADGVEFMSYSSFSESYKQNPRTENNFPFLILSENKFHLGIAESAWVGSSDDVEKPKFWQQHDTQPSSAADVSALQQRMTAAETAIGEKLNSSMQRTYATTEDMLADMANIPNGAWCAIINTHSGGVSAQNDDDYLL